MKLSSKEFIRNPIKNNPLILITGGSDDYRALFLKKLYALLLLADCDKTHYNFQINQDWDGLLNDLQSYPLFSELSLVTLKLAKSKLDKSNGAKLLDALNYSDLKKRLIISLPKLKKNDEKQEWYQHALNTGVVIELSQLTHRDLNNWVLKKASAANLTINPEAISFLLFKTEGNLEAINQELHKLALRYREQPISLEMMEKSLTYQADYTLYLLSDAYLSQDLKRTQTVFNQLKNSGTEPALLLWILTQDVRQLCQLSKLIDSGVPFQRACQTLKIWSSRQSLYQKCYQAHQRRSLFSLLNILNHCDQVLKGSRQGNLINYLELCTLFLASADPHFENMLTLSFDHHHII